MHTGGGRDGAVAVAWLSRIRDGVGSLHTPAFLMPSWAKDQCVAAVNFVAAR